MPEHLRALVVVLVIASAVFVVAQRASADIVPISTLKRWRNLWFVLTLALFLAHSYWIFALILVGAGLLVVQREVHVMGLYFALLFVAPPVLVQLPGFGVVNFIIALDHYRLLALGLLLPAALSLAARRTTVRLGQSPVDWWLLGFLALVSFLQFRHGNVTAAARGVVGAWLDIFLPYYVASRSIRDLEGFRHAALGFVLGGLLMSAMALFEMLRNWKLYTAVLGALGLNPNHFGGYLARAGLLRPNVTVGNSIVVGYVIVVAFGLYCFLKPWVARSWLWWAGLAALAVGVLASLARGPWVGLAFLIMAYLLTGPSPVSRMVKMVGAAVVAFFALRQFESGRLFLDMLPFVGQVDAGNVDYRSDLLTNAMIVIGRYPFFGSMHYLQEPELRAMIQGDGIIDIVNSYIAVALDYGLVGLALFAGVFLTSLLQLRRARRTLKAVHPEADLLARVLLVTLSAVLLIIFTVSSITAIPVVYWCFAGLCAAYALMVRSAALDPSGLTSPVPSTR
jgi:hypothetical protein